MWAWVRWIHRNVDLLHFLISLKLSTLFLSPPLPSWYLETLNILFLVVTLWATYAKVRQASSAQTLLQPPGASCRCYCCWTPRMLRAPLFVRVHSQTERVCGTGEGGCKRHAPGCCTSGCIR